MSGSTNGSNLFRLKPAFGGFGSSPAQTSPFGSAIQSPQPAFGSNTHQSQPAFGSSIFGSSTPFGASSQPAFSLGSSTQASTEMDGSFGQYGKLESISAMSVYKDKSHEELRWEDYQLGDKGGPIASAPQSTGMAGFNSSTTQTNAFSPSPSPAFGQSSSNPFSSTTPNSNNPFAPKISTFSPGFGTSAPAFSSSAFGSSTSAAAPSIFGPSQTPFGVNSSSQPFGSSPSFGVNTSSQPFGASTSSPFGSSIFGNTQSSQLFSSSTPTNPQSGSAFGQNTSPFGQTGAFSRPSLFGSPSSGLVGSIFSSSASLTSNAPTGFGQTAPSMSTPFQTAQPAQSSGTFAFNFDRTQPGTQTPTQAFANTAIGKSEFRGRRGGSRVASYSPTFIADTPPPPIQTEKLESISAIPLYKDKSHEELRFEDYQLGSSAPTNAQSGSEFGQNTFPFGQTAGFRQSSFFGSHSSGLVGSIFSSMASLKSNAPSLAILTGTVVVTVVVTRWISLRGRRA